VTKQQIMNLRDDVQTFIAASDIYQACLIKAAKANAAFQQQATKLVAANQREKERVGNIFNGLIGATKQKNAQADGSSNLERVARDLDRQ
jgi:hypothetical protein